MATAALVLNNLGKKEKMLAMADIRPISDEERKIIIGNAMNDEKIGDKVLDVLKYIEYLSRDYGVAWPSNSHLAKKLGFSDRSISRYIAILVATGYVVRNFVYRNGKIFVRTLALDYKKAKVVVKVNAPNLVDIISGVNVSKKQFFAYLKSTENKQEKRKKIAGNNAGDYSEKIFLYAVGEQFGGQVGVSNIYNNYNTKYMKENISSSEDIYARARAASYSCKKPSKVKILNGFSRESYWKLIDRKIPAVNAETKQLNELMKQHTKQRMLFRKAPTNYALELTINGLFDRFKNMKNRIKAVEKAVKNGWINIGGGAGNKCKKIRKECEASLYAADYGSILPSVSSLKDWVSVL